MYTFDFGDVTIFHNNDVRSTADVYVQVNSSGVRIDVPQQALIAFVAQLVADSSISQLEQAEPHDVLGIPAPHKTKGL